MNSYDFFNEPEAESIPEVSKGEDLDSSFCESVISSYSKDYQNQGIRLKLKFGPTVYIIPQPIVKKGKVMSNLN